VGIRKKIELFKGDSEFRSVDFLFPISYSLLAYPKKLEGYRLVVAED
jgi:hypothetical protein